MHRQSGFFLSKASRAGGRERGGGSRSRVRSISSVQKRRISIKLTRSCAVNKHAGDWCGARLDCADLPITGIPRHGILAPASSRSIIHPSLQRHRHMHAPLAPLHCPPRPRQSSAHRKYPPLLQPDLTTRQRRRTARHTQREARVWGKQPDTESASKLNKTHPLARPHTTDPDLTLCPATYEYASSLTSQPNKTHSFTHTHTRTHTLSHTHPHPYSEQRPCRTSKCTSAQTASTWSHAG